MTPGTTALSAGWGGLGSGRAFAGSDHRRSGLRFAATDRQAQG